MYDSLFIGNKIVNLKEVDSTNIYLKEYVSENEKTIEGLVVSAKNQLKGRGQVGKRWESEEGKNLTFSIYLKPNILVYHQFLISKTISLGILDFLSDLGLEDLKIKWPNDIYVGGNKICGILIENSIKENKIYNTVVGIGLNVNQVNFGYWVNDNTTSLTLELKKEKFIIKELLNQLLFFIEKRYLLLKTNNEQKINDDYHNSLYFLNELRGYQINKKTVVGSIIGVNTFGKLQVKLDNEIKLFDLQEIQFFKNEKWAK